ncbi:hypothetical protein BLOT_008838 [Blomia tropicalis]|nr:hypothetical protein BLOT_008838 [Blomia tropicalis]
MDSIPTNQIECLLIMNANSNQHDSIRCQLKVFTYHIIKKYLWLFPLIDGLLLLFLNVVFYVWAIPQDDVYPIFPYLSDIGSILPQAPFFSQFIDMIAILCKFCL